MLIEDKTEVKPTAVKVEEIVLASLLLADLPCLSFVNNMRMATKGSDSTKMSFVSLSASNFCVKVAYSTLLKVTLSFEKCFREQ